MFVDISGQLFFDLRIVLCESVHVDKARSLRAETSRSHRITRCAIGSPFSEPAGKFDNRCRCSVETMRRHRAATQLRFSSDRSLLSY